jgi:hypothetical protein
MNPEIISWLMRAGGAWGLFLFALWIFRDRIYFSFGRMPPAPRLEPRNRVTARKRNRARR